MSDPFAMLQPRPYGDRHFPTEPWEKQAQDVLRVWEDQHPHSSPDELFLVFESHAPLDLPPWQRKAASTMSVHRLLDGFDPSYLWETDIGTALWHFQIERTLGHSLNEFLRYEASDLESSANEHPVFTRKRVRLVEAIRAEFLRRRQWAEEQMRARAHLTESGFVDWMAHKDQDAARLIGQFCSAQVTKARPIRTRTAVLEEKSQAQVPEDLRARRLENDLDEIKIQKQRAALAKHS